MLIKKAFFDFTRESLFSGSLSQTQVSGMEAVLDYWDSNHADKPQSYLAYILATAFIETAHTFKPIQERGGNNYLKRMYDVTGSRPDLARRYGNTEPGDGIKYAGKGLVQLTWKANYQHQSHKLGVDLVNHPELMLDLSTSVTVLVEGMLDGDFRGVKLSNYLSAVDESNLWQSFVLCRNVINANLDNADSYADAAMLFYNALKAASSNNAMDSIPYDSRINKSDLATTGVTDDDIRDFRDFEEWRRFVRSRQNRSSSAESVQPQPHPSDTKPLWKSAVARWVVAGISCYISVKYGLNIPAEARDIAENAIIIVMGAGVLRGRINATKFISGIFK